MHPPLSAEITPSWNALSLKHSAYSQNKGKSNNKRQKYKVNRRKMSFCFCIFTA